MVQNKHKNKNFKSPVKKKENWTVSKIESDENDSDNEKDTEVVAEVEAGKDSEEQMETENEDTLKVDQNGEDHKEAEEEDDEMDLDNLDMKPKKKKKKGIIYISNIPKFMNVTILREMLGEFGKIGRVYLQPEKLPGTGKDPKKKKKRFSRHFTEGWVEFESKRTAKQVAEFLNNKQISTRKKSHFYDSLWSMKYLPRFKWIHLTERMNYEQAVHKQRLMTEVSQARKETHFFQNNLDQSEYLKKRNKKGNKKEQSEEA